MNKSSEFHHIVSESIKNRRSLRAYDTKPIEASKINSLFEAARWAPSSSNEQPWFYIFATRDQKELWDKLFNCLNEGNRIWAKDAPMLMISLARKTFSRNGNANAFAMYDLGAANSFLALQAVDLGLQLRQMGGFNHATARESFNIGEEYAIGPMIAVGYPGKTENLPEILHERERAPRERFLQTEFARNAGF